MSAKASTSGSPGPAPVETPELVERSRRGDKPAMEALIGRYQHAVARFVVTQVGSHGSCEDICQTIFVKMLLALPRLRSLESFEPWLFQIARNACRDHLRTQSRLRKVFVPWGPEHEGIAQVSEQAEEAGGDQLAEALGQLPVQQKELLILSSDGERSYYDLAQAFGLSLSALKSRLHRARENLRRRMRQKEPGRS